MYAKINTTKGDILIQLEYEKANYELSSLIKFS